MPNHRQGRAVACPNTYMTEDTHYQVLKILEQNPQISQRELAEEMGLSLGKVNYCLKAILDIGLTMVRNSKNSTNKWAYFYVLTSRGGGQG